VGERKMKRKTMLANLILLTLLASTSTALAATKHTATFIVTPVSGYAPLLSKIGIKVCGSFLQY
jgi:hypothetical protein